jgi:hypothetical protein
MSFNPAGSKWSVAVLDNNGAFSGFHPTPWEFQDTTMHAGTHWTGSYRAVNDADNSYLCEILMTGASGVSDAFEVVFVTPDHFFATKSGALYRFGKKLQHDTITTAPKPEPAKPEPAKPEPPQPPRSAKVVISHIHFLGTAKDAQADEFIEVRNIGDAPQDLSGWRIAAGDRKLAFTFPAGTSLDPGASVRVYTDLDAPGPGRFSFESNGRAVWNDKGAEGTLFDSKGAVVSKYGYRSHESRTIESIKAACGVPGLIVRHDPKVAAAQEKSRDRVDFLTAVERALRSLIEDPPGGVDSTAATIVRDAWDEAGPNPDDATLQRVIREHLNGKKILELLAEDSGELPEAPGVKTHWVFAVKADFNPPGHWVVVDRTSAEPARQVF